MPNEEDFAALHDGIIEMRIRDMLKHKKIKSIKKVEVYRRKVKKKFLKFFWITKKIQVIKYIVNESEFVIEVLIDNLDVKRLADLYASGYEVEIVDLQGNTII